MTSPGKSESFPLTSNIRKSLEFVSMKLFSLSCAGPHGRARVNVRTLESLFILDQICIFSPIIKDLAGHSKSRNLSLDRDTWVLETHEQSDHAHVCTPTQFNIFVYCILMDRCLWITPNYCFHTYTINQ